MYIFSPSLSLLLLALSKLQYKKYISSSQLQPVERTIEQQQAAVAQPRLRERKKKMVTKLNAVGKKIHSGAQTHQTSEHKYDLGTQE